MAAEAPLAMDLSTSGDSSESDFDEIDASPEDMDTIMQLETALQTNPNLYESHVQYVNLLRKCKLREKLRTARESMQEHYPLTEQLWLEWLHDEAVTATSITETEQASQLFQKAVQDYLSVPIWKAYINFVKEHAAGSQQNSNTSMQNLREICEQALTAAGLHITLGGSLWDAYREYEHELSARDPTSDAQLLRVRQLYHRQLQVPLAEAAQTMQSYLKWEASLPHAQQAIQAPSHVQQGFQKAQQAVSLRHEHEAMVAPDKPADENLLAAFLAYIKYEEAKGDPARVQLVYERALAAFPVTHYLWQAYAHYLEDHLKVPAAINAVYSRALRNCPWVGSLWANALRALELSTVFDEQQHATLYSSAVQAGLQTADDYMEVVLARLDALRHRGADRAQELKQGFQQAAELMQTYFPDYIDRTLRIHAYWADCEMHVGQDPAAAEAVWEGVLKSTAARYVETWIGYITMLIGSDNTGQARRVYKRGYSRKLEEAGQLFLCQAWLRFEREHGTADTLAEASRKVRPILEQAAAAAAVVSDSEGSAKAQAAAKKAKKLTPEEMKKMRQQADPNYQSKQAAAAAAATAGDGIATGSKKGKKGKGPAARAEPAAQAESASLPAPAAAVAAAVAEPTAKHASADAMPSDAAAVKHSTAQAASQALHDQASSAGSKRRHGLGFSEDQPGPKKSKQADGVDKAADSLQQAQHAQQAQQPPSSFSAGPPSNQPPVSKTQSQQSKPANVQAAAGAQSSAGAAQGPPVIFTDECTAFVRGLDNKVTEEELRNLLAACGEIKGVRLVMDKVTGMFKVVIMLSLQHAYVACTVLRHLMSWSCTSAAKLACRAGMPAHCCSVSVTWDIQHKCQMVSCTPTGNAWTLHALRTKVIVVYRALGMWSLPTIAPSRRL
ncbi:TPA: hypothetical protein ACH3X2_009718 [Trebouxia sp. C0005]